VNLPRKRHCCRLQVGASARKGLNLDDLILVEWNVMISLVVIFLWSRDYRRAG
jgi:hypothetical protein